jgi:hypothetical protein
MKTLFKDSHLSFSFHVMLKCGKNLPATKLPQPRTLATACLSYFFA